jgi:hypothetical protein
MLMPKSGDGKATGPDLSTLRTFRVLRPLKLVSGVPSKEMSMEEPGATMHCRLCINCYGTGVMCLCVCVEGVGGIATICKDDSPLFSSAGNLKQSVRARNREGIGLSSLPARLHRLVGQYDNSVPTRFL